MRISSSILLSSLSVGLLAAEPNSAVAVDQESSSKEVATERLLSERSSPEALESVIKEARRQNISEQAILEARFVFHVDRNEDAHLVALLPEFLKHEESFKLEDSEIFATIEEWQAVIQYVKALAALQQGDKAGFKSHITEAFWLSPKQGNAFATHIDRLRAEEALSSMKIDFSESFKSITEDQSASLSSIIGDSKALLLQFWSPQSGECEASLPDFTKITAELLPQGVAVATVILEHSQSAIADTRKMIGSKPPGTWLADHDLNSLSSRMRIQNVPTYILISKDGHVMAFGTADQKDLWETLSKLNPSIKQPELNSSSKDTLTE